MSANQSLGASESGAEPSSSGKTIDLQGVAAFVGLVELLAQELGTSPGRIQGHLPNGPAAFEELAGEISLNSQGFLRNLALLAHPGEPLRMRFYCTWGGNAKTPEGDTVGGVEAHFFLDATVESILPQGRALARYVEDTFGVLDRLVTLGHGGKLSSSVSAAEIEAFELTEQGKLVSHAQPKTHESFDPS